MSDFSDSMKGVLIPTENTGLSEASKKHLIELGIFAGILVAILGILIAFVLLSRQSWINGLKSCAEQVLLENELNYKIADYEEINNPFSVSSAFYKLIREEGDTETQNKHIAIIRIATPYGPAVAVFIYEEGMDSAQFIDFVAIHGKIKKNFYDNSAKKIEYWGKRIPAIIGIKK